MINFFTKENNKTIINSKNIMLSEVQSVSKIVSKSFEVDEDTYSYLSFLDAVCSIEDGKFLIKSYIVKIIDNDNQEKNYFAVSLKQVQLIRNEFKNIQSKLILSEASNLIEALQATKIKINFH